MKTRGELKRDIENERFDMNFYREILDDLKWKHLQVKAEHLIEVDKLKGEIKQLRSTIEAIKMFCITESNNPSILDSIK